MNDFAIRVENLSKVYRLYDKPADRLKESIHPLRKKYHRDFYALNDVSFEVKKGETVGIIGKNGSGKSTLLKIITGVLTPSWGNVTVNGKVSALLELGAGFNPEYTGVENIYLNGTLMGYSKEEMDAKVQAILEFADIGEFVNQPVKMYSSGMFIRLAFAVAISVEPDILIVDEALSVGDAFFQAKCIDRMKKMIERGITLFFVSHDTGAVKSLCKKCILLNEGNVIYYGSSDKAIEKYFEMKVKSEQVVLSSPEISSDREDLGLRNGDNVGKVFTSNLKFQKKASFQRIKNGKASFINVQLLSEDGKEITSVDYGQSVTLRMAIEISEDMPSLLSGYHIRDKNGVDIIYSDSAIEGKCLTSVEEGEKYIIDWNFKATLVQGSYNIACVLSVPIDMKIGKVIFCDFVPLALQFTVHPRKDSQLYGSVHWENIVEIQKV